VNRLLASRPVERPWGREQLPAPFVAPAGTRIGEIWFETPAEIEQLLVKYIFTSQALSVQVHPSDAQALGGRGKEECWLVTSAEPGARLGIGFIEPLGAEAMRAAALDGTIEDLLEWHPAAPGDFFYIPAGTVHAIGAGIGLIEVQQNCDITYRLYDYGRPRELHLDAGIAVAQGLPQDPALRRHLPATGSVPLVEGPHFRLERIDGAPDAAALARYEGPVLVLPLGGEVTVGAQVARPGDCALAASLAEVAAATGIHWLAAQPCA
jgi:mannose-6-phosphate isomerase